jgi:hypothetical protein
MFLLNRAKYAKRTFSDVYEQGDNATIYSGQEYTVTPLTPNASDVYVYDCFFHNCSSSSNGGALCCSSSVCRLLVEQSSFISCKISSLYGGGIYISNTYSGGCVLSRICAFNCYSTNSSSYGQFAYIRINNSINNKNHVNDSSITHTLKKGTNPYYALRLNLGNILCPSVNLTNNECYNCPVLYCQPTSSCNYCMSYSSIVNNTANGGYGCIWFDGWTSSYCIDTCNVLNNNQTAFDSGTIRSYGNLLIKDSCILGNNERKTVFYESRSSLMIIISNCTIDDDIISNTRYVGGFTINKTIENAFINALSHIATKSCDSYFDSYGTLTAKPNAPSKNPRYLMSCNKHTSINPLRSMQFMFLLTMLPSDPASDYYFNSNYIYLHLAFGNN